MSKSNLKCRRPFSVGIPKQRPWEFMTQWNTTANKSSFLTEVTKRKPMRGAQPYVASKWQRRDLNLARYFLREGSPTPSEGLLHDYKLDFGNSQGKTSETWHGGIATIFQSPGDEVWGVVWKMNKSNLSSLDEQEGVKSGTYVPIEVNVYTQEGKITCRSYQMKNYESAPPSPQYKKVICLGAKENGLPLEYQKKLNAIEPNDYKGEVSEEIEDIIRKGETKAH
ncbi:gamma-glutamylcyclotransferase isoform X1 [Ailuropoda melanoleuca]|uniref:gamma-glutamylcyclotransferase isoform X1 n=1 Tax=Ailuropoda melanoleuca TaxID=9646 RepID=UPI001494921B|nr:gamma-glutamylcyclotransferase isoform X1 [Ailuropoda melanoleuca]